MGKLKDGLKIVSYNLQKPLVACNWRLAAGSWWLFLHELSKSLNELRNLNQSLC